MESCLRRVTWRRAGPLRHLTCKVLRQLEKELDLIDELGFAGYFLIVWDIVNFAARTDILVQGRGSAANSAVCYSLGITAVDPVGGNLLFERFLTEGRKSWPDIDLDLPSGERREQVIQEVYRRYGEHGAAMTANVITYRGRSAMREIGKALNLPDDVLDRFSGSSPAAISRTRWIWRTRSRRPACRWNIRAPARWFRSTSGSTVCPATWASTRGGHGHLPGAARLHRAAGERLHARARRRAVGQGRLRGPGIIKVDLLGLGMMAVLQDAIELCRERGHPVDLATIPKDDAATFDAMCRADTIGVFQVETRAQMATLPRMKPRCFYDVVIEVAIIRPGPIQGNMVHPYLARRAGKEKPTYFERRSCSSPSWSARWACRSSRSRCSRSPWSWPISPAARPRNCAAR